LSLSAVQEADILIVHHQQLCHKRSALQVLGLQLIEAGLEFLVAYLSISVLLDK